MIPCRVLDEGNQPYDAVFYGLIEEYDDRGKYDDRGVTSVTMAVIAYPEGGMYLRLVHPSKVSLIPSTPVKK